MHKTSDPTLLKKQPQLQHCFRSPIVTEQRAGTSMPCIHVMQGCMRFVFACYSGNRLLLTQAVHAELHLYMLVKVLCFSDWHLNQHHIERHVCLDCCCIGLFGGEAVHSVEPLCMKPAGRQKNTALLLVLHWLPKHYACAHTRSSDTLCTRRSHLSFCCHASLQHKHVSRSMLQPY